MVVACNTLARNGRHVGIAKPRSPFLSACSSAENPNVRTADDLQHIGGGGLLLQRFTYIRPVITLAQFIEQAGVLNSNDGLPGKMTSSICLSVNGQTSARKIMIAPTSLPSLEHRNATKVPTPPSTQPCGRDPLGEGAAPPSIFGAGGSSEARFRPQTMRG